MEVGEDPQQERVEIGRVGIVPVGAARGYHDALQRVPGGLRRQYLGDFARKLREVHEGLCGAPYDDHPASAGELAVAREFGRQEPIVLRCFVERPSLGVQPRHGEDLQCRWVLDPVRTSPEGSVIRLGKVFLLLVAQEHP